MIDGKSYIQFEKIVCSEIKYGNHQYSTQVLSTQICIYVQTAIDMIESYTFFFDHPPATYILINEQWGIKLFICYYYFNGTFLHVYSLNGDDSKK